MCATVTPCDLSVTTGFEPVLHPPRGSNPILRHRTLLRMWGTSQRGIFAKEVTPPYATTLIIIHTFIVASRLKQQKRAGLAALFHLHYPMPPGVGFLSVGVSLHRQRQPPQSSLSFGGDCGLYPLDSQSTALATVPFNAAQVSQCSVSP